MDTASQFLRRWAWLPLSACVVLLAFALWRDRHDAALLKARWKNLEHQSTAAAARPYATSPAAGGSAPNPGAVASNTATPGTTQPTQPPPGALAAFSDRNALGEPDYAAAIARRQRRYAMARNRDAVDALHLPPADAARLKELLADRAVRTADAADVLDRMGNASGELRAKASAAARAESDANIQALLGPEKYAEFQTQKAISATEETNWALFTDFWAAGVALSPDQQTALARSMVETGASPYVAAATTGHPPTAESSERLAAVAAAFLSTDQLAFFRAHQASETQYRQAQRPPRP